MNATKTVLLEWKDTYSVSSPLIDGQHKVLVGMLNSLHAAMIDGKGRAVSGQILSDLVTYTKVHFSTEERIMSERGYPGFKAHKAEHDKLTAEVVKFQDAFAAGTTGLSLDLLEFLKNWLSKHILESDQKYVPFL